MTRWCLHSNDFPAFFPLTFIILCCNSLVSQFEAIKVPILFERNPELYKKMSFFKLHFAVHILKGFFIFFKIGPDFQKLTNVFFLAADAHKKNTTLLANATAFASVVP